MHLFPFFSFWLCLITAFRTSSFQKNKRTRGVCAARIPRGAPKLPWRERWVLVRLWEEAGMEMCALAATRLIAHKCH